MIGRPVVIYLILNFFYIYERVRALLRSDKVE